MQRFKDFKSLNHSWSANAGVVIINNANFALQSEEVVQGQKGQLGKLSWGSDQMRVPKNIITKQKLCCGCWLFALWAIWLQRNVPTCEWRPCHVLEHGPLTLADDWWQDIDLIEKLRQWLGSKLTVVHSLPWPLPAFWQQEVIFSTDIIHMRPKSGSQCQGPKTPRLGGGFVT